MLSHLTAAELVGLCEPVPVIHVTVPTRRRVMAPTGAVIHYHNRSEERLHPTRTPPQTRVEETVLDLTQTASSIEHAAGWLTSACSRRLTTAARIKAVLIERKKVRWRSALIEALDDAANG
jgi:hypothetical protein